MPILYSPTGQKVWAEPGTYEYNDYIRGGFTTTPPASAANTNYATSPIEQNQTTTTPAPTNTGTPNQNIPTYNQATTSGGNYIRAGIVTPALKVDEQYQKYFGRPGSYQEREYWIFRPINELEAQLQSDYQNASGHSYDGTAIMPGQTKSQRDLNPNQYANTPNPTTTPTPETGTTTSTTESTGNAQVDKMIEIMQAFLNKMNSQGQYINPNIEITPEKVAEFMAAAEGDSDLFKQYAEGEINPYYQTQLAAAREGFLRNMGYSLGEIMIYEDQLAKKYKKDYQGIGEAAANRGFAQSGLRQQEERDLGNAFQETISQNRRDLANQAENAARDFAMKYGSAELPTLNISNYPRAAFGGEVQKSTATTPFYNLSDSVYNNLIGSEEFSRRGAVQSRASELEEAFRTQEAINQQRNLI